MKLLFNYIIFHLKHLRLKFKCWRNLAKVHFPNLVRAKLIGSAFQPLSGLL